MGKICTFCQYKKPDNKCRLIESSASVEYTERCTCYEPVTNVAPVIHAHWIEEEDCSVVTDIPWSMCAACGEYSPKLLYCAFCGAKMDGGEL